MLFASRSTSLTFVEDPIHVQCCEEGAFWQVCISMFLSSLEVKPVDCICQALMRMWRQVCAAAAAGGGCGLPCGRPGCSARAPAGATSQQLSTALAVVACGQRGRNTGTCTCTWTSMHDVAWPYLSEAWPLCAGCAGKVAAAAGGRQCPRGADRDGLQACAGELLNLWMLLVSVPGTFKPPLSYTHWC